ncbi:MAG: PTS IIA-like nitrogen regulatory protein PtsN [Amphritea sp.]|uniref:PTS IIA-like nitrogen regulatory protein PtsN n=1 Tax=Amphritea sp. TaxID=1872502 RepID=UPI001B729B3E|nr:PTS IIA-like nitrogen regulatory protein PtsN [Amphritea sp.]MBQ0757673.1 PTS IIA-like nitrogen regulatory protein PtsN [Amphritea sp.]MBQ0784699.1 PTS IIA-like nitrogen regulatory protein PtsN [Amphritea sp.]
MLISELLAPSGVLCALEGGSKKRILEIASEHIAELHPELDAETIFTGLINRERLGSTGIGDGIAIPHSRLDECEQATALLIQLKEPIDFDSVDSKPVDLLFVLLVPSEACDQHLQTLGNLAELFSQPEFRNRLRSASSCESLYTAVTEFKQG